MTKMTTMSKRPKYLSKKRSKIVNVDNPNDKNYQNLFLNQMILGSILVLE